MWIKRDSDDEFDKEDFRISLLYKRHVNLFDNKEIFNVFGHTPNNTPVIRNHFANIDTGVCYKERYGVLTALEFPTMKLITQDNIEE